MDILYRYFPSKRAIVLALYDRLSDEYARDAMRMNAGKWRDRFIFALQTSLDVLAPHRPSLRAFIPVLVSGGDEGLLAAGTAFSRLRVQLVFEEAVTRSSDAPPRPVSESLGRLLYLLHLLVLLWWLLDSSPKQRATKGLVALFGQMLPSVSVALLVPAVRRFVMAADALIADALFQNPSAG